MFNADKLVCCSITFHFKDLKINYGTSSAFSATKTMKQRNKWWICAAARVYAGQFIAATETTGELYGRINEEKI